MHECTFFWAKFITFLGINIIANGILFNYNLCKNTKCEKEEEKKSERKRKIQKERLLLFFVLLCNYVYVYVSLFFAENLCVWMNEKITKHPVDIRCSSDTITKGRPTCALSQTFARAINNNNNNSAVNIQFNVFYWTKIAIYDQFF